MALETVGSPAKASGADAGVTKMKAASAYDREAVWGRFEAQVAARGAAQSPILQEHISSERAWAAPRPISLAVPAPETGAAVAQAPRVAAVGVPAAHQGRGAWFYRLQGAALTGVVALAALAAVQLSNPPALEGVVAPVVAPADQSAAFADAFAQTARAESAAAQPSAATSPPGADAAPAEDAPEAEAIARITAADPPYRVVLHIAPEASPRDVARLDTAIKAWGFAAPEQRAAAEAVVLPEVAFHAGQDREAALIVARIADRILAEAVLTPPAAALAGTEGAGLIEVYVTTR